jgi:hypothetical protein
VAKPDFSKYLTPKAIVNLFLIGGFLVFIIPTLIYLGQEIKERSSSLKAERVEIDLRSKSISRLAELRKASEEAAVAGEKLELLLPPRDELFSFTDYVKQLAGQNGVVANLDFSGTETAPTETSAGSNGFQLAASGRLNNIISFIEALESGNRFFSSLEGVEVTEIGAEFSAVLNGLVYFYD